MGVPNLKGHTRNLWGKCPLYGSNATGGLISQEIHYWPLNGHALLEKEIQTSDGYGLLSHQSILPGLEGAMHDWTRICPLGVP